LLTAVEFGVFAKLAGRKLTGAELGAKSLRGTAKSGAIHGRDAWFLTH
jgi:hypothetical protein